jgi:hypothetical protein
MMIAEDYLAGSERYAARLAEDGLAHRVTLRSLGLVGDLINWLARSRFRVADMDEAME